MDKLPEHISPELLLAFINQQISDDSAALVQSWLDSSPENLKYFEQIQVVWEETGKLIPAPVDVDIEMAWDNMSHKIDLFDKKKENIQGAEKKVIPLQIYLMRVAAVILPLIAVSAILFLLLQKPGIITHTTTSQTLCDTLSDGSIINISKNSGITYPKKFKGGNREVEMNGEVSFDVKPNKEKPFIIYAENTLIKVLGTSFIVQAFADSIDIEVSVKSGRVLFSGNGKEPADTVSVILEAGDKGIYNKSTKIMSKADLPVRNEMQKKSNILIFTRTNLSKVLDTLQKNYKITVVLKDKSLGNLHFTATFMDQSVDSIIDVIANSFDLKVKRQGKTYILEQNEE